MTNETAIGRQRLLEKEARRIAGVSAFWAKHRRTGMSSVIMAERARKGWEKRRKQGRTSIDASITPEDRERRRQGAKRLSEDASILEKRRIAARHAIQTNPKLLISLQQRARDLADKKRGFKVPAAQWAEYRKLMRKIGNARAVGLAMGLTT